MKIIYFITTLYLGILGIWALFFNLTKWDWLLRIFLGLIAFACLVFTLSYQQREKKIDEEKRAYSEMRTDYQMKEIKGKLDDLKEKEKKGLFEDIDYLNRIGWELDRLNLNLEKNERIIKEQYLTIYFNEIEKIPKFYNWEEWKETENILFNRIFRHLQGYFNARGVFNSGEWKELEKEFNQQREKYIKAKEREFKK